MEIKLEILDTPSRSKGWGRAALLNDDTGIPVIRSNTGNEWVSGTSYVGEAEDGSILRLRLQVQLNVGKGARSRKETSLDETILVAEAGAVAEIGHKPGSQGIKVRITGARVG